MFRVITITYNRRQLLEKAIHSVLAQTHAQFEYYIVDDGSTDGTAAMVAGINDKRLNYLWVENTGGQLARLRNEGMSHTASQVIVFLDSDDYWEPGYLAQLYEAYKQPGTGCTISNATIHKASGSEILFSDALITRAKKDPLRARLLNAGFVIYPSCFSFKQQAPPLLFDNTLKQGDSALFLRLLAMKSAVILDAPMVNILKHGTNMSMDMGANAPFIQTFAEEFKTLEQLKRNGKVSWWINARTRSRYFYQLAGNFSQTGRRSISLKNFLKAFYAFPLNFKALAKFFFLLFRGS